MSKLIISSKVALRLAQNLSHHLCTLQHQPITIELTDGDSAGKIKISSVEGSIEYELKAEFLTQKK